MTATISVSEFNCTVNVVKGATGSAYVESPTARITAAVLGPRQMTNPADVRPEGRVVVSVRLNGQPDVSGAAVMSQRERNVASAVSQAVDAVLLTSRMGQVIYDVVINVHSGDVATEIDVAVCAASLALAHAHVECRDLISGCTALIGADGTVVGCGDVTPSDVRASAARLCVASTTSTEEVVYFSLVGVVPGKSMSDSVGQALAKCVAVNVARRAAMRQALM